MPGDIGAAAADSVISLFFDEFPWHGRQEHKQAGDADVIEGIIAGLMRTSAAKALAGGILYCLSGKIFRFGHHSHVVVFGCPATARRIDVHLGDAVARQIKPKFIGKPGRSPITSSRMARPPGHPQASRHLIAAVVENPRQF